MHQDTETEPGSDVLVAVEGRLGHLLLNRPRRINALTLDMVRTVQSALEDWADDPAVDAVLIDGAGERGLCAGADIRALYEGMRGGGDGTGEAASPLAFLAEEYRMNATLGHYRKPVVAIMSGLTLGGGVGISGHCRVRVVTESSQVGMPETAIGLCPDVGGLYLLSRSPGEWGTHAALTGARFGPEEAIAAGLADRFLPSADLAGLVGSLRLGVVPDPVQARRPAVTAPPAWIDACYVGDDPAAILGALQAHPEPAAQQAATVLAAMSPTAVAVTVAAIRRARSLSLDQVLDQDLRVGSRFVRHPDLAEGIRAQVIDKDRRPTWHPPTLGEVSPADVQAFFAPLDPADEKALRPS